MKPKPKGSTPPKGLQEQVAALAQEPKEAREQQSATFEVPKVISSSQGDLEPVFQAMLENAVRICDASFGVVSLRCRARERGGDGRAPPLCRVPRRGPQRPGRGPRLHA